MKLLALEFSTATASLALLDGGAVVAAAAVDAGHRRSQGLFAAAEGLLHGAGCTFADVGAFAVGRGPGSYTGLRVSLTAARGWALPEHARAQLSEQLSPGAWRRAARPRR